MFLFAKWKKSSNVTIALRLLAVATKPISKADLLEMINTAIDSGSKEYGVNRSFIRKFLADRFGVPQTPHFAKRINKVLSVNVERGNLILDAAHGLFLLA